MTPTRPVHCVSEGEVRLIDLSHPIQEGMPVYPGDPHVSIASALSIETDGVAVARLDLGSHTGTHLDAPAHSIAGGRTVDQLRLHELDGPADVLPVTSARDSLDRAHLAESEIQLGDLGTIPEQLADIVCIATGWDHFYHDPKRERHPFLSLELAQELWARGARVLGVDTLSPDKTDPGSVAFPVHEFWLGNDGIIAENLRGIIGLPQRISMSLFPLKLTELDGSPVRAVARLA